MGRLFWKIFLWFWITLILIGSAVAWGTAIYINHSDAFEQRDMRSRFVSFRVESLRSVLQHGGEQALRDLLQEMPQKRKRFQMYVLDDDDNEILGREIDIADGRLLEHDPVITANGEQYLIYTSRWKRGKKRPDKRFFKPFQRNPEIYFVWLGIAILVSGLVCFWLAWYLSKPIRNLQFATQKLADGKLDTRVASLMGKRRDEIADLGRDFDKMASQLQSLVNNQKQLLSDISHELRSPLARLQVALGLTRKKAGDEIATEIDRLEQEANRLDELIGQSLTLSRLDAGAEYPKDDFIDIKELLESIISDCDYEASSNNKHVVFDAKHNWTIKANGELLRRALENIIRNAIHYTPRETTVEVYLKDNGDNILIRVCDQGNGVPDEKIERLFEPFVRLSEARDRDSGGYGLGLAIAHRAINFHQGSISATNREQGGLCMDIEIPKQ